MTNAGDDQLRERFDLLVNAPALFNAITTAVEVGLFRHLSAHPRSAFAELRQVTGVPAHQLRVLLQAVCATGLLEKTDGTYQNSTLADELLASDATDGWAHILVGWKEIYYPAFAQMTTALKAGTNTALEMFPGDGPTLYQRLSGDPEREAVFHRAMAAFTLRSLDALVERPEFAAVRHLLDIGGGDGTTSSRLTARHPELHATVFDIPSVSALGEDSSPSRPERVAFRPGDMFNDPFPTGCDAILFSHVLEIFSGDQILSLLKKAYDTLPRGGRVFIYGYNVSDDETDGIYGARLGLYLNILASGQGMAYPAREYEEWLRSSGFADVHTVSGLPYEHGLSSGAKP
ncbi:class I SAM-dependent methyltransferase [Actinomadura meridiana]|uniref:Class I SAM-dependent methyltransferase n=1 Tax=Actinomadura meridiana TaxID=559626 RepID=A0ABP8CJJ0_9ACTN